MARIQEYRPATLRQQLNQDLAKALAYQKNGQPDKAESWAQRLWRHMVRARLVSGGDHDEYRAELRRSLREDQ